MKKPEHRHLSSGKWHLKRGWFIVAFLLFQLALSGEMKAQYVRDSTGNNSLETSENNRNAPGSFRERLVPGGSFGLNFGNPWYLDLSPSLGYQVNEKLVAGAGISYNAFGGSFAGRKYRFERYGASVFSRYRLFDAIFANGEIELLNVPDELSVTDSRVWIVNPLIGASYIMPIGNRGGVQASLLYNLNYNENLSPYPSPLIWRIGFFL